MHEIFATESGYEYRGIGYRSLSEVAREITGTRWSGPAFFGLKNANSVLGHCDDKGENSRLVGGGGGIRTPGTLSGPTVFKTAGLNLSATPPR